jgi:hypothetical protein
VLFVCAETTRGATPHAEKTVRTVASALVAKHFVTLFMVSCLPFIGIYNQREKARFLLLSSISRNNEGGLKRSPFPDSVLPDEDIRGDPGLRLEDDMARDEGCVAINPDVRDLRLYAGQHLPDLLTGEICLAVEHLSVPCDEDEIVRQQPFESRDIVPIGGGCDGVIDPFDFRCGWVLCDADQWCQSCKYKDEAFQTKRFHGFPLVVDLLSAGCRSPYCR